MYNYIDNKNNSITGVYSGFVQPWTDGGTGTNPMPINCEHTVPQSFFWEANPMVSDIYHLFPTYSN
ncbi:endonuclease [Bernardetia litoralis]|uniref:endonuclease n=1 Tax=Bernardetia litoralis TaxID=999 RepID=UPI0012FE28DF